MKGHLQAVLHEQTDWFDKMLCCITCLIWSTVMSLCVYKVGCCMKITIVFLIMCVNMSLNTTYATCPITSCKHTLLSQSFSEWDEVSEVGQEHSHLLTSTSLCLSISMQWHQHCVRIKAFLVQNVMLFVSTWLKSHCNKSVSMLLHYLE